ncbi:hypothetical protein ACFQ2B_36385 [Streptomyces stramineus]|uniref:Uncharacterized protein n=1 Tax=Streptomyces stramineus TaxID=173861 RepID=A0ABP3J708_9ACTN
MQDAVRRQARTRTFAEAEDIISTVLSDPAVQEARERVEAEAGLGMELRARLQPFQDRYDQAVAEGATRPGSRRSVRASTAAEGGSASCPTGTNPGWRSRTGATTARASRSRG